MGVILARLDLIQWQFIEVSYKTKLILLKLEFKNIRICSLNYLDDYLANL